MATKDPKDYNPQRSLNFSVQPPGVISSDDIASEIQEIADALARGRRGSQKPTDIRDGEVWVKDLADGSFEIYRWVTADGETDGTLIFGGWATNEELNKENPTEAELVELTKKIPNARQFLEKLIDKFDKSGGVVTGSVILEGTGTDTATYKDTLSVVSGNDVGQTAYSARYDKVSGAVVKIDSGNNLADTSKNGVFYFDYTNGTIYHSNSFAPTIPAPRPKPGTTDIGSWVSINTTPYTLPNGGTWAAFIFASSAAGAVQTGGGSVGLYAGGTVFNQASGYLNKGFAWRIM